MLLAPRVAVWTVLSAWTLGYADHVLTGCCALVPSTHWLTGLPVGWVEARGAMHSIFSVARCAPSFPAPNSRFSKALLEPSLFPGMGQTARAGFWAQIDGQR